MPQIAGRIADAFEALVREHEDAWLSPLAVRSYDTLGRLRPEDECGVRTPFQRDRDRIVHSKPFRRLKGKTQVFIDPAGDHYRTRMTHTLETTAISRVVARALRLNEDLVEAIGLGHDTGHPPFGHAGEDALEHDLVETSERAGDIAQSDDVGEAMLSLRSFMFDHVYLGEHARAEHARAHRVVERIFAVLADRGDDPDAITEFIAGMTDRF